jgi:hypothetical protein
MTNKTNKTNKTKNTKTKTANMIYTLNPSTLGSSVGIDLMDKITLQDAHAIADACNGSITHTANGLPYIRDNTGRVLATLHIADNTPDNTPDNTEDNPEEKPEETQEKPREPEPVDLTDAPTVKHDVAYRHNFVNGTGRASKDSRLVVPTKGKTVFVDPLTGTDKTLWGTDRARILAHVQDAKTQGDVTVDLVRSGSRYLIRINGLTQSWIDNKPIKGFSDHAVASFACRIARDELT